MIGRQAVDPYIRSSRWAYPLLTLAFGPCNPRTMKVSPKNMQSSGFVFGGLLEPGKPDQCLPVHLGAVLIDKSECGRIAPDVIKGVEVFRDDCIAVPG